MHGWVWVTTLPKNRKVNRNETLENLFIPDEGLFVHLRGYGWVTVFKFVAKNGRIDYVTTNEKNPTRKAIKSIVAARWSIEVYHRELKQTCGIERCQARTGRAKEIIFASQFLLGLTSTGVVFKKPYHFISRIGMSLNKPSLQILRRLWHLLETKVRNSCLSRSEPDHKIYPYLLRAMEIKKLNEVWCTDITYIKMQVGFAYLVVMMDWCSRYVLSWQLSNSLDASFCVEALETALLSHGVPKIFNTDQGSQFTSEDFTRVLLNHGIKISRDGRGRYLDNIFQERLWRSVKYHGNRSSKNEHELKIEAVLFIYGSKSLYCH